MKKIFTIICMLLTILVFSQQKINLATIGYNNTRYIITSTPNITKVGFQGTGSEELPAPKNATFVVVKKFDDDISYLIKFDKWNISNRLFGKAVNRLIRQNLALRYNYLRPNATTDKKNGTDSSSNNATNAKITFSNTEIDNNEKTLVTLEEAYFKIAKKDLEEYVYVYEPRNRADFTLGTISYATRIRPHVDSIPSRWTTDLSLGLSAGAYKPMGKYAGLSLLLGFSITNVTLDSISTRGKLRSAAQQVAISPSLNALFTYKIFSIGVGLGWDWVNKDSEITKSWVFNGKHFWGIAFGVNIFRSSEENKTVKASNN